jgi:hypothetical protein
MHPPGAAGRLVKGEWEPQQGDERPVKKASKVLKKKMVNTAGRGEPYHDIMPAGSLLLLLGVIKCPQAHTSTQAEARNNAPPFFLSFKHTRLYLCTPPPQKARSFRDGSKTYSWEFLAILDSRRLAFRDLSQQRKDAYVSWLHSQL